MTTPDPLDLRRRTLVDEYGERAVIEFEQAYELERLRRVEAAARDVTDPSHHQWVTGEYASVPLHELDALRQALEDDHAG
jgi:hypothetical protein